MTPIEIDLTEIESKIYLIRGERVMKFSLTNQEVTNLKSQIATSSSSWGGRRKPTQAFTEQGVAMLSSVLNSPRAIDVSIAIMRTFVKLRNILNSNQELEKRITDLEPKYDGKFQVVFAAIKKLIADQSTPRKKIGGLTDP